MKYSSANCLHDFVFHDAEFEFESYAENKLCVLVYKLNVLKTSKENPYDFDMEIERARMSFENVKVHSFEYMKAIIQSPDGNMYTEEPETILSDDAEEHFFKAVKNGFSVNGADIRKDADRTFMEIETNSQCYFNAEISFERVLVEWDDFSAEAWYELQKKRDDHAEE